jgi:dihydrofolate reductase
VSDGLGLVLVLVHRAMSLDGFIAGPDHEMDWIFEYHAPAEGADVMTTTGAMLSGRGTYEAALRSA